MEIGNSSITKWKSKLKKLLGKGREGKTRQLPLCTHTSSVCGNVNVDRAALQFANAISMPQRHGE